MSSAPIKKWDDTAASPAPESTDTGTISGEALRLPDSMPDNLAALGVPVNDLAILPAAPKGLPEAPANLTGATPPNMNEVTAVTNLGIPVAAETDVTPPVSIQIAPVEFVLPIEDEETVATQILNFPTDEITAVTHSNVFVDSEITNVSPVPGFPDAPIATFPNLEITAVTALPTEEKLSADKTAEHTIPNLDITTPVNAIAFQDEVTDVSDIVTNDVAAAAPAKANSTAPTPEGNSAQFVEATTKVNAQPTAASTPVAAAPPVAVTPNAAATEVITTTTQMNGEANVRHFSKNAKRIALAALISASGFIFTIAWYKLGAAGAHLANSRQIAKIIRSVNEVQRKPITKLIWQPIFDKDIIYAGEAIRTASTAEATIELLDSGTRIDLDPDSAIVLEESAGKLALNFLQGNLLVKSGSGTNANGTAAPEITLKTGEKQIALGNSELSLGKSSTGQLDLQVLKGQAQVMGDGKTVTLDQGNSLSGLSLALLKPTGDDSIYIEPNAGEKITFEWAPLTKGEYTVSLEAGPTRQSIKPIAGAIATGQSGKLETAELKTGRIYYRLVARSANPQFKELTSTVVKNTVIAKIPPLPITPEKDLKLAISQDHPSVAFAWSNSAGLPEVYFKLSRTADFKVLLTEKTVKGNQNNLSYDFTASGKYYWQLSGRSNGKTIAESKVVSFDLVITRGLPSPHLLRPLELEKISYDTFKNNGLLLSWEQVANAAKYKVTIASAKGSDPVYVETELLQTRLKDLKPGAYTWTVLAVNEKGDLSLTPEKRQFQLVELPLIPWADGKGQSDYQYITLKPSLELQWLKPAAAAVRYMVHVTAENAAASVDGAAPAPEKTANANGLISTLNLDTDGSYFAEIEAFDSSGHVVARSSRRQVKVSPAPLLPPPTFAEGIPLEITAGGNGAMALSWSNVPGASKYTVTLKNDKGEPKRELAFTTSEGQLRGLMPGDYKVALRSIDQHGRPGPEGEERVLKVPNVSNVRAPKLKGLKVK